MFFMKRMETLTMKENRGVGAEVLTNGGIRVSIFQNVFPFSKQD